MTSPTVVSNELPAVEDEGKKGKKSLRMGFPFRRKSVLSMMDVTDDAEPVAPSAPLATPSLSASSASSLSFETDPSTPMSSRSTSRHSEMSSASSSSSSEGVKTPSEVPPQMDVDIAGGKLAVALAAADVKRGRKGSWIGWLGGKRSGPKATTSSGTGAITPIEVANSTETSPSAMLLNVDLPQVTLTPSSDIIVSDRSSISLDQTSKHGLITEQMRRCSFSKLSQLRAPSPHPLALALKRQYSNLPEEVACSIQSGQKVFPLSVNMRDTSGGLNPMQGGLSTSLGIKSLLVKLEKGECPDSPLFARRRSDPMIVRRPKGVLDFINRPPFEERNIVFCANGTVSPISMARPEYGIWDLDFSEYILALSAVDTVKSTPWPNLPRASMGAPMDGFERVMAEARDPAPSPESESEEMLVTPAPVVAVLENIARVESAPLQEDEETISSFRRVKKLPQTWEESSDEEDDDEEDEAPLAKMIDKAGSKVLTSSLAPPRPAVRERTQSAPTGKRVSLLLDNEVMQKKNMDEVARARERRAANVTGETERLAEAQKYRRSMSSTQLAPTRKAAVQVPKYAPAPPNNASSSSLPRATALSNPSGPIREDRRRTQSSYNLSGVLSRPEPTRAPSAPEGMPSRKFHSFYELPTSSSASQPSYQAMVPQQTGGSMFPPSAYAYPSMPAMPGYMHQQPMMFQPTYVPSMAMNMGIGMGMPAINHQAAMYMHMQGQAHAMASRSSLAVPSYSSRPVSGHYPRTQSSSTLNKQAATRRQA